MSMTLNYFGGLGEKNRNCADIIAKCFTYKNQIHIYHWQTRSYARHKASDTLLDGLVDFTDKFIETYMGRYGRPNFTTSNIPLTNMGEDKIDSYLNEMVHYFTNEVPKYLDSNKDTDLLNIRDEILGVINTVKYLFTLN